MRTFCRFVVWVFTATNLEESFEEWSGKRELARRERYIVHRLKTQWLFSGLLRDVRGHYADAGIIRSPRPMRRAQALRYFRKLHPHATINHIDDRNKIITFTGA